MTADSVWKTLDPQPLRHKLVHYRKLSALHGTNLSDTVSKHPIKSRFPEPEPNFRLEIAPKPKPYSNLSNPKP